MPNVSLDDHWKPTQAQTTPEVAFKDQAMVNKSGRQAEVHAQDSTPKGWRQALQHYYQDNARRVLRFRIKQPLFAGWQEVRQCHRLLSPCQHCFF